ncbi:tyrosine-type recombinase/integrase [Azoarcus sp. TTM-91]|nr:tyrosine-type recombinase/integrase [Azoarcus sp. TTM-91]
MSELRKRMNDAMVLRGFARRTQTSYLACVAGLAQYYRRSPDALDAAQIQAYLLHLITERKLAYASVNQAACAIRFLLATVLGRTEVALEIPMAKVPKRLPLVLTREEVARLFACSRRLRLRSRTLLMTKYAAGLRLSEVCALRLSDIESAPDRMCLKVRQGKGGKDRYTLLSPRLLEGLRLYWRATWAARRRSRSCCTPGPRICAVTFTCMRSSPAVRSVHTASGCGRRRVSCFRCPRSRACSAANSSRPLHRRRSTRAGCPLPNGRVSSRSAMPTTGWSMPSSRWAGPMRCLSIWAATPTGSRSRTSASSALKASTLPSACAPRPAAARSARCVCPALNSSAASCCTCYRPASNASATTGCSRPRASDPAWPPRGPRSR